MPKKPKHAKKESQSEGMRTEDGKAPAPARSYYYDDAYGYTDYVAEEDGEDADDDDADGQA